MGKGSGLVYGLRVEGYYRGWRCVSMGIIHGNGDRDE